MVYSRYRTLPPDRLVIYFVIVLTFIVLMTLVSKWTILAAVFWFLGRLLSPDPLERAIAVCLLVLAGFVSLIMTSPSITNPEPPPAWSLNADGSEKFTMAYWLKVSTAKRPQPTGFFFTGPPAP